ncbi:MAG: t-SNARE [Benjaminiella poitrasii]|nr:MAG: t-SNARE [Benjaminiella poitrasii]
MSSRFTMSRDRLAELRGANNNEKRYDRLSDEDESVPPMPTHLYDTAPDYRPPVPPTATYNTHSRGDRHASESKKETYEMTERIPTSGGVITTDQFFQEVEHVKELNRHIIQNITVIEELHGLSLSNINDDRQTEGNNARLEKIVRQTTKLNNECKQKIRAIEASNARIPASAGDIAMRKTQHAALKKKFMETIQRYQDIERTYQQKYRQRVERQIKIVQPNATQDDIDRVLESDEPPQIFAQSLMQSSRSGQAKAVLSEVQSRHDDIKRIEKTILELHQLFVDMQMMVEQQAETIQQIESHAETTVVDLEQGTKDIDKAIVYAKSTRAKKWICFVIFIIILIAAGILIWWFGFDHAGIN